MKDKDKTKKQLINELEEMRQRLTEMEAFESASKRAKEESRLAHEEFEQIFNSAKDAMCVIDQAFNILRANTAFYDLAGLGKGKAVAKKCYEVFGGAACHTRECPLARVSGGEERFQCELEKNRHDGSTFPCVISATSFRTPDGELIGIVEDLADVTERRRVERSLQESEARYRALVEQIPAITYTAALDDLSTTLYVSPQVEKILGYSKEEYRLDPDMWVRALHPDDCERVLGEVAECHATHGPFLSEYRMIGRDGRVVWFRDEAAIVRDSEERPLMLQGVMFDITKRKQAEKLLLESEEKYRVLVKNIPSIVYTGFKDWSVEFIDAKIELLTGYHADEFNLKKMKWIDLIVEEDIEAVKKSFVEALRAEKSFVREYRIKNAAGNILWIQERGQIVCDPNGQIQYVSGVFFDITERKMVEEHIRALTQQLLRAQENSGQRIARDLHDQVAQDLSTLKIACETLFDNQPAIPPEIRQRVSELGKILQHSITAIRDLAYDLRPPSLDQLGLVRTIFQYCEDFSERRGVKVDFYSAGMDGLKLDFDTEINLYRLVQEALNNVKKHADASNVKIRLVASFPKIILRIEDDGKGFDVKDQMIRAINDKRLGLRGMDERVRLLGGEMTVQSRLTQGTRILIEIPCKEDRSDAKENRIDRR
jgi:PAS domain S-box-containing protein